MSSHEFDLADMQGMLRKRKSGMSLFSKEAPRFFKVQQIGPPGQGELALCYYTHPRDKEAKGWLFLDDITSIEDNGQEFTVVSPGRTLVLGTQTAQELESWLRGLCHLCPNARTQLITQFRPFKKNGAKDKGAGGGESKEDRGKKDKVKDATKPKEKGESKRDDRESRESRGKPQDMSIPASEREDHRITSNFNRGDSSTSRLHGHIRRDENVIKSGAVDGARRSGRGGGSENSSEEGVGESKFDDVGGVGGRDRGVSFEQPIYAATPYGASIIGYGDSPGKGAGPIDSKKSVNYTTEIRSAENEEGDWEDGDRDRDRTRAVGNGQHHRREIGLEDSLEEEDLESMSLHVEKKNRNRDQQSNAETGKSRFYHDDDDEHKKDDGEYKSMDSEAPTTRSSSPPPRSESSAGSATVNTMTPDRPVANRRTAMDGCFTDSPDKGKNPARPSVESMLGAVRKINLHDIDEDTSTGTGTDGYSDGKTLAASTTGPGRERALSMEYKDGDFDTPININLGAGAHAHRMDTATSLAVNPNSASPTSKKGGKPPRPPTGPRPTFAKKNIALDGSQAGGVSADSNFVEDDWDDSPHKRGKPPAESKDGRDENMANSRAESKEAKGYIYKPEFAGGVKPDTNFIDDDWDE